MKTLCVSFALALLLAACGKSEDSSSNPSDGGGSGGGSASGTNGDDKPWDDVTKPYITEKRMGDMVSSLKEEKNPFLAFTKGVSAFNATERVEEFNAYAKKSGFESGEEYMASWTRIMGIRTQLMTEESMEALLKAQEDMAKNAEEALKRPDLTPEQRETYESQAKGAREAIKAYSQPREGGFNAQDVEAYKKHKTAFEAALKEMEKLK